MQTRFRLYRSLGFGYVHASMHAMRMSALVVLLPLAAACHAPSPTAPTQQVQKVEQVVSVQEAAVCVQQEVLHDSIPFSIKGHEDTVLQLCTTQVRTYYSASGERVEQRDFYAQSEPCPSTPIP